MPSKVIMLMHILRAVPIYYLMLLEFTVAGYKELEAVCRQFLWGFQVGGQAKVPLVAWSKICQPRSEGGLGVTEFKTQAQIYKLCFLAKILDNHPTDWVLAKTEICAGL